MPLVFREKNVTKEVCRQVKQLADQPLTETEKLKKVLVFYNPTANGQYACVYACMCMIISSYDAVTCLCYFIS